MSLFGSYAKGRRDLFTDLDLFVVWDTDRSLLERQRYLYSLLSLPVDLDIVCYTPAELAAAADSPLNLHLRQEESSSLSRSPREDGRRWLEQATEDLRWADHLAVQGGYHIACFFAQQVGEKALKAFLYVAYVAERFER